MDGYARLNTDENGKVLDVWDMWFKNSKIEDYINEVGIEYHLDDYNLIPNSLLLITFIVKTSFDYINYIDGFEYFDEFIIKDEIVLIKNYNLEDMKKEKN